MKIVYVEFKSKGKQYAFFDNNLELEINDYVVVETERGLQFGKIVNICKNTSEKEHAKVVKVATAKDIKQNENNIKEAEKAVIKAQELSNDFKLSMKFIDAFYTFDQRQLIFQFLSDGRVDFRELAKSLAGIYKTRIELRQVGVRDKAKEISGVGPCGRKLCCSCFLNDLDSVTINMVKNQNLALNPTKINGLCGRLLCCLKYEDELYTNNRSILPEYGQRLENEGFKGIVTFLDIPNKKYILTSEDGEKKEFILDDKCEKCEKKCSRK